MNNYYKDLPTSGANKAEIKAHLSECESVAVTVRIPTNLKEAAAEYVYMRGMSLSTLFRNCFIYELSKKN